MHSNHIPFARVISRLARICISGYSQDPGTPGTRISVRAKNTGPGVTNKVSRPILAFSVCFSIRTVSHRNLGLGRGAALWWPWSSDSTHFITAGSWHAPRCPIISNIRTSGVQVNRGLCEGYGLHSSNTPRNTNSLRSRLITSMSPLELARLRTRILRSRIDMLGC